MLYIMHGKDVHMRISVIGLGTMGGRIADALLRGGQQVLGHDIDPAARARAEQAGIAVVGDDVVPWGGCDVVLLSLPGPDECRQVATSIARRPSGARAVIDLSTVDPRTSQECARVLADAGVGFLDAPVLGRPPACGSWTLPVGGAAERLEEVRPVLSLLAKSVRHVGETGSGSVVKLLNNLMFAVINTVSVQVLDLASKVGLEPSTFYGTVVDSGAATVSPLFREIGRSILEDDFTPAFTLALLEKDNRLGVEMARAAGGSLPLNEVVGPLLERALAEGLGSEDTSALVKLVRSTGGAS